MPNLAKRPHQLPIKKQLELCRVTKESAKLILDELWYQYASKLVDKVAEVCNLDSAQTTALKVGALRPNDLCVCEQN